MRLTRIVAIAALAALAALAAACTEPAGPDDFVCGREEQRLVPLYQQRLIDLLFVVDRTPSMADQAATLAANAPELANVLQQIEGGLPDLHVAVVTTDLGGDGVPGCGAGDGGRFQGGARCGLDGSFLRARGRADGTREQNFPGDVAAGFACLFDVPLATCPVSQPLAAIVGAVDGSAAGNDGFRRIGAQLLIVIITDGDDCSLIDRSALAGIGGATPAEVEAAVDFACFARGTACEPTDPATPGIHSACVGRDDAGLASLGATLDWLRPAEPKRLVVAVVGGDADAVVVAGPALAPTCTGALSVGPAPRLATLDGELPDRFTAVDACGENWTDALVQLASLGTPVGNPCFDPAVDVEPLVPGIQADCVSRLMVGSQSTPLPWCGEPGARPPCLRALEDRVQCPAQGISIQVELGDARLPSGSYADLRCRLRCP